jgi:hypothetical protein
MMMWTASFGTSRSSKTLVMVLESVRVDGGSNVGLDAGFGGGQILDLVNQFLDRHRYSFA